MALNLNNRKTYSNIQTNLKSQVNINVEMIIKKEITDYKINRKTQEKIAIYNYKLNADFWKNIKEPINICIDEAHTILNARRSMSKINIIVSDWLALIRRVLGQTDSGFGELTFISQLINRIDIIAREMATNIIYTICHYVKTCKECTTSWQENSEMPEGFIVCPACQSNNILKHSHNIECWYFPNIHLFDAWHKYGQKTFYKHTLINDIEDYFPLYNTLAWDNMFTTMF